MDSDWLSGYRNCAWENVVELQGDGSFDIGYDSCFAMMDNGGCYAISRVYTPDLGKIDYQCILVPSHSNVANILVIRSEDLNGAILHPDNWNVAATISEQNFQQGVQYKLELGKLTNMVKGIAESNNYSTMPPYMLHLAAAMRRPKRKKLFGIF